MILVTSDIYPSLNGIYRSIDSLKFRALNCYGSNIGEFKVYGNKVYLVTNNKPTRIGDYHDENDS